MRWDPHPEPLAEHPDHAVLYAATDIATTVAEVFQTTRRIDLVSGAPHLTGWIPSRPLRLLDLTGTWPVRNGAASALQAAPRPTCRRWAAAIHDTWPDLDGVRATSTMTGLPVIVLWAPAADSFPDAPAFTRPLTQPHTRATVTQAAERLGDRT